MTVGRGAASPAAGTPPSAAEAEPLQLAVRRYADQALVAAYVEARAQFERIYLPITEHFNHQDGRGGIERSFVDHGFALGRRCLDLRDMMVADLEAKMASSVSRLAVWARFGSPLEPLREVPVAVRKVMKVEDMVAGTAVAPGLALFDLHVGREPVASPAAGPTAPAQPPTEPQSVGPRGGSQTLSGPAPTFSVKVLRAWYLLRRETWPADQAAPTEAEDLAAASAYFRTAVPRDMFREIRKKSASEAWRKRGPRGPRRPRE